MLRRVTVWGGIVLALGASIVLAQEQRRGFGGFGFGGRGGNAGAMLLGIPEVQKELGISVEQKGLVEDMQADLREQFRNSFSGFQGFQDLSQEERQKRFDEARKKGEEIDKKAEEMIKMILEPKQVERLDQLRLQREGARALDRAEIADKVGLSEEQRAKIKKIYEDARPDPSSFPRRDASDEERRQAFAKMREMTEKANADVLALLTPEQTEKWTALQGKKFDFPAPPQGRRPGGN